MNNLDFQEDDNYDNEYFNNSSEEIEEPKEFQEDLSQYENRDVYARYGRYRIGYSIQISYSYSGSGELFKVRPNSFTLTSNKITVDEYSSRVSFELTPDSQTPIVYLYIKLIKKEGINTFLLK